MGALDLVISVVLEARKQQAGPAFCKLEQVLYGGSPSWRPDEKNLFRNSISNSVL